MMWWVCNLTRAERSKSELCRSINLSSRKGLTIEGVIISELLTETSGLSGSSTSDPPLAFLHKGEFSLETVISLEHM